MKTWYELWSKAGASPTYRIDNIPDSDKGDTTWEYIRVPCLNFIPGLCCPHYDKIQSNNIHRAIDFENMMRRHSNERGICIDHWASIVIPGDGTFEIFSPKDKVGSVNLETKTFDQDRNRVPGVWIKDVVNIICDTFDYHKINWEKEKPMGQIRRPTNKKLLSPLIQYTYNSRTKNFDRCRI